MPLYKFVGNKVLTRFENAAARRRAHRVALGLPRLLASHALPTIPFERNSDGFDFDTQIIIAAASTPGSGSSRSRSRPTTATRSATSTACSYATDVVTRRRALPRSARWASAPASSGSVDDEYGLKESEGSSHSRHPGAARGPAAAAGPRPRLLERAAGRRCPRRSATTSPASTPRAARSVDARRRVRRGPTSSTASRPRSAPASTSSIAADVLEHLRHPEQLLGRDRPVLRAGRPADRVGAELRPLVPAHRAPWSVPSTTTSAASSTRPTTGSSPARAWPRMVQRAGFEIRRHREVGLPFDVLSGDGGSVPTRVLRSVDKVAVSLRPTLFAYQFVWHLQRPSAPSVLSRARAAESAPDDTIAPQRAEPAAPGAGVAVAARRRSDRCGSPRPRPRAGTPGSAPRCRARCRPGWPR